MSARRARLVFEPLLDWPHPPARHERSPFTARWPQTRDLLLREADALGATLVVVELDLQRTDLRQDGEIRANARLGSGKVRASLDTKHGPMRFACDRYHHGTLSWQANARAIALTMRNVLIQRPDGTRVVRPFRGLRVYKGLTAEQMVESVVGSAALDGYTTSQEEREALLGIATGELDVDEVVSGLVAQAKAEVSDG